MWKRITGAGSAVVLAVSASPFVAAQEAPDFMRETLPSEAVTAAFEEFGAIMEDGALEQKTKELIGLAVAAQVPCDYCVEYHTMAAESLGATEQEIKEAVAAAALVRHWSTMLNGSQYDREAWQSEIEAMTANQSGQDASSGR